VTTLRGRPGFLFFVVVVVVVVVVAVLDPAAGSV
jgi:hypothetical protein